MATSQNGYTANDISLTSVQLVPGTERKLRLRTGDTGYLLTHFAAWFDKNIESIDNDGELDDWGYSERKIRGSSTTLSNHASGTAIDLNAPEHWLGERNTFSDAQEVKIREQLKVYEGCIRWGGDYRNRADEMHFEINKPYASVQRVARKLRSPSDPSDPVAPAPMVDTTIRLWSLNYALTGKPMNGTAHFDVRQFMAFVSELGDGRYQLTEDGWNAAVKREDWARAAELVRYAVKVVQAFGKILQDGIPGENTAVVIRRYGWTVI